MEINLTESQKQAVTRNDADLCVTAGAGSGKTRVLVERFVRLVLQDGVPVERILAITFTEKAAAEMKERIAEAFEKAGKEDERRRVEFAYILTIDAFCARLLRENALEAGVDPRFTVLEEFEAERVLREVADEVLLGQPEERLLGLLESTGIPDLGETLLRLQGEIRHSGMPLIPESLDPPERPETALVEIRARLFELRQSMEGLAPEQREKVAGHLGLAAELEAIPRTDTPARQFDAVFDLRKRIHLGKVRSDRVQGPLREIKEVLLDRFLGERVEEKVRPFRALLGDLLSALDMAYERAKRTSSSLDFADLEWKVRRLLVEAPAVRDGIRRRFLHLFLDELQDTNPLQKEILDLLRGENCFFSAGDGKQSIYGFRDADVRILVEVRKQAELTGGHLALPENFRSRPEIVAFVNRLFSSPLWISVAVPFEPMIAAAEHVGKAVPSVEILRVHGGSADEARQNEARALAERIAALVEDAALAVTRKDSERLGTPLGYGDVAILFRYTSSMRIYECELAARQIPYFVQKGRGYFQTQEVRDLMNLIRVLDNPRDDVSLAAVLRSPLCGVTDDDLYRLCRRQASQRRGRLADRIAADAIDLSESGRERLKAFRELLERLRSRKGQGPLWVGLEEVLSESNLAAGALLHFNGRRRFANLRKLVDRVRVWESRGETSLPELVEILEDYSAPEIRESEAAVESPGENSVRLMTIHAAKGLEFPLAVLADLGRTGRRRDSEEIFRRGSGLGIPLYDPREGRRSLYPSSYLALRADGDRAESEEENRLLYVAATRAQEHLILSGWEADSTRGKASWMAGILRALDLETAAFEEGAAVRAGDPDLLLLGATGKAEPRRRRTSLRKEHENSLVRGERLAESPEIREAGPRAEEILRRAALPSPPPDSTPFTVTATEVLQHHLCPRRYHLRYGIAAPSLEYSRVGDLLDEGTPSEVKDDEVPAEVLGDRVHRVLAEESDSAFAGQLLDTLEGEVRVEALRQVKTFRESRLGREAEEGEPLKEFPFALAREGAALRGQIDLIIRRRDGGLLVVDYKTSRVGKEGVEEKAADYELQLRVYALAVREIFGRLPAGAFLHFLHPDVIREVDLSPPSLEATEEAIAAFFAAHRKGAFPQRPASHCLSCGYLKAYCPNLRPSDRGTAAGGAAPRR